MEVRVAQANAQYNERVENDLAEEVRERQLESGPNYHKDIFATWGTHAQSPFVHERTPGQLPRPVFEPVSNNAFLFFAKKLRTAQEKLPPTLRRLARMDELQEELNQLKRDNAELHVIIGKQGRELRDAKHKVQTLSSEAITAAEEHRREVERGNELARIGLVYARQVKRVKRDDEEDARSPPQAKADYEAMAEELCSPQQRE